MRKTLFMVASLLFSVLLTAVFPWVQLGTYLGTYHSLNYLLLLMTWLPAAYAIPWVVTAVRAARGDTHRTRVIALACLLFLCVLSAVLAGFAQTYYSLFGHSGGFNAQLSRMDAVYFTFGVFTTAGSGFTAKSSSAEAIVIVEMAATLVLVGVVLAAMVGNALRD